MARLRIKKMDRRLGLRLYDLVCGSRKVGSLVVNPSPGGHEINWTGAGGLHRRSFRPGPLPLAVASARRIAGSIRCP